MKTFESNAQRFETVCFSIPSHFVFIFLNVVLLLFEEVEGPFRLHVHDR